MQRKEETYAIRGYFFGKNYHDLFATIGGSFRRTGAAIAETWEVIGEAIPDHGVFLGIGLIVLSFLIVIFRAVFGFLFTAIFSVLHIIIISIIMAVFYVHFVVVWAIDKTYRTIHRVSNNCPSCQRKYGLPVYHCPNCGAPHRYLFPSSYGVYHHRCTCGTLLPTVYVNGRHHLNASCPHCGARAFPGIHSAVLFPVFGGRSSGKTCFINMALEEMEERANGLDCVYHYFYDAQGDQRESARQRMRNGALPDSTSDETLIYYNFYFTPRKAKIHNFISLCDVKGEVFNQREKIESLTGYRYADEVVFVIDPISIDGFRNHLHEQGYDVAHFVYSEDSISTILGAMITSLEAMYKTKKPRLNLTVVITKGDAPELEELIGETAVSRYVSQNGGTRLAARNELCKRFLFQYGESNAYNQLIQNFTNVQFFTVSSLGKDHQEGEAFVSEHAADPVLWLVDRHYSNLNFNKELWKR